jgi:predicted TIM-barrel enzyme
MPDSSSGDFAARVAELAARVSAAGKHDDGATTVAFVDALRAEPEVEELEPLVAYRRRETEARIGLLDRVRDEARQLERLAGLDLAAAPRLVSVVPLGRTRGILVSHYPAFPGERLIRADAQVFGPAAQERFLRDMKVLAEQGLIHPYAGRGVHALWVTSETGGLVLDSWPVVREADADERAKVLRVVEDVFARQTKATWRNRLRGVFGVPRVLLPVIHPASWDQALASVRVAIDARVKGVFLINQGMSTEEVLRLVLEVRRLHPTLWVGVNLLGLDPAAALATALEACEGSIDGIWSDDADIGGTAAQAFLEERRRRGWTGLYFGGVAFKYQTPVPAAELSDVAEAALPYVDVVCTSGPGTGMEASPQKLAAMRGGMGHSAALALASGVTADNVVHYLLHVDAFLVGTGIEASVGVLDPGKLQRLQAEIAAYDPATAAARARAATDPMVATVQRLEAIRWGTAPTWERRARDLLFDFYRRVLPFWPEGAHKILPADAKVLAALRARLSSTDVTRVDANVKRLGNKLTSTTRSLIELILTGAILRARGQLDETTDPGVPLLQLFEAGYDLNPTHGGVDVMYAAGMTTVPLPTRAQLEAPSR